MTEINIKFEPCNEFQQKLLNTYINAINLIVEQFKTKKKKNKASIEINRED